MPTTVFVICMLLMVMWIWSHKVMHEMDLVEEGEGWATWVCPICGRKLRLQWQPDYKKEVFVVGDQYTPHTGSQGSSWGFKITDSAPITKEEVEGLTPWLKFLEAL